MGGGDRLADLEGFLHARGSDLSQLLVEAAEALPVAAGDTLIAVGSLVEGLASSKSDLDLLLVRAPGAAGAGHLAWASGRCLVDMRVEPGEHIQRLLSRFAAWGADAESLAHAPPFSLDERTLLHRLHHGAPLDRGGRRPPPPPPSLFDLARLKLQTARQAARTIQVDMAGLRDAQDYASLAIAAQELGGHAIDGLLAGHLQTNPLLKWRHRLLERLPETWDADIYAPRSDGGPSAVFWRTMRYPRDCQAAAVTAYAQRLTQYSRALFLSAEARLRLAPTMILDRRVEEGAGPPAPCLDFDVDVIAIEQGAWLSRLNAFTAPLALSPTETKAALLLDGIRDVATIDRLAAPSADGTAPPVTAALVDRLARQDLLARQGLLAPRF